MTLKARTAKACKAMKNLGYADKIVRPVLKELLELYENNWMLIEEENYRVLVDAILDSEERKSRSKLVQANAWSEDEDEDEDEEPLLKRSRLSCPKNQSSSSLPACIPYYSNEVKKFISDGNDNLNPLVPLAYVESTAHKSVSCHDALDYRMISYGRGNPKCFFKETESQLHDDLALVENVFDKHLYEADIECEPLSYGLPDFGVPLAVIPPDHPKLLLQGSSHEKCSNANANCSVFPEVVHLEAEDMNPLMLEKDAYSRGNSSDLEGSLSESINYRQSELEKNENDDRDSLKLDIASSSGGEVKMSLMVKYSLGSDFHVPSLEALLKMVEEQCLKSYRIRQTGFSTLRVMKEVCEGFLAAITSSTHTEDVIPDSAVPSLGISSSPDSEAGPTEGIDHQLCLCSKSAGTNDPARIQNLYQVSSQIPRFIGSVRLDLSFCKIYLTMDVNVPSEIEGNIMELYSCAPSSSRMMTVQMGCSHPYIEDITKGEEAYGISLINEINEDQGPKFSYISKNVTHQGAQIRFCLASISEESCCPSCFGDCLSLEIPCMCSCKTGGKFAYTQEGLVKEKFLDNVIARNRSVQKHDFFYCQDCPLGWSNDKSTSSNCKGHKMRTFIKECWYKCGCGMKCGNRVVQRGITAKLQVFKTPEKKGWGLRTLQDIPKGAFICEYVGEVLTNRELCSRYMQNAVNNRTYAILLDADWKSAGVWKDEEALCLDARIYGNIARFINHRCFDANLVEIPVEVETPDRRYYHMALLTTRKVYALEELTWDYGIDFNDHQPGRAFQCCCGSKFCRDSRSLES